MLSHSADCDSDLPLFVAKRLTEVCQEIELIIIKMFYALVSSSSSSSKR